MSQTSYSASAAVAKEGMLAEEQGAVFRSFKVEAAVKNGVLVERGSSDDEVKYIAAVADDADSIIDATPGITSAATEQTLSGADLDGAIGGDPIRPAQRVSLTLNSHTDWDDTTAVVYGEDVDGNYLEDTIAIPNGGNATVSTTKAFSRVQSIYIPAQTGTNGTATAGTLNDDEMIMDRAHFPGVPLYEAGKEPATGTVITGVDADHDTYDVCRVLTKGKVWVVVEAAVSAGDPCYVRMTESGTDIRGQFRGSPATGFAKRPHAVFVTDQASADGFAILELL